MNTNVIDEVLQALLAATPPAPPLDLDPTDILEQANQMISTREPLLQTLRGYLSEPHAISLEGSSCLSDIEARNLSWEASLRRARYELSLRLVSVKRLSKYEP